MLLKINVPVYYRNYLFIITAMFSQAFAREGLLKRAAFVKKRCCDPGKMRKNLTSIPNYPFSESHRVIIYVPADQAVRRDVNSGVIFSHVRANSRVGTMPGRTCIGACVNMAVHMYDS